MITNSGLKCDICGKFILPFLHDDYMSTEDKQHHAHRECGKKYNTNYDEENKNEQKSKNQNHRC